MFSFSTEHDIKFRICRLITRFQLKYDTEKLRSKCLFVFKTIRNLVSKYSDTLGYALLRQCLNRH